MKLAAVLDEPTRKTEVAARRAVRNALLVVIVSAFPLSCVEPSLSVSYDLTELCTVAPARLHYLPAPGGGTVADLEAEQPVSILAGPSDGWYEVSVLVNETTREGYLRVEELGECPEVADPAAGIHYLLPYCAGTKPPVSQGQDTAGSHQGWDRFAIDFSMITGTPVLAAASGVVRYAQYADGLAGNVVILGHDAEQESAYFHLSSIAVEVGNTVEQGQTIGLSGATGNVTGPHLHFKVQTPPADGLGYWHDSVSSWSFWDGGAAFIPQYGKDLEEGSESENGVGNPDCEI